MSIEQISHYQWLLDLDNHIENDSIAVRNYFRKRIIVAELFELTGNMHMHTPYSDGEKWHVDIAEDAIKAGLDFIIVTDHNIWVDGVEGYYENGNGRDRQIITPPNRHRFHKGRGNGDHQRREDSRHRDDFW